MTQTKQTKTKREFAQLQCDFMFKRLFGSEANKDVLIGFLNMILEDVQIKHVDFIPTEHLGLTKEDRKCVFDALKSVLFPTLGSPTIPSFIY